MDTKYLQGVHETIFTVIVVTLSNFTSLVGMSFHRSEQERLFDDTSRLGVVIHVGYPPLVVLL